MNFVPFFSKICFLEYSTMYFQIEGYDHIRMLWIMLYYFTKQSYQYKGWGLVGLYMGHPYIIKL